MDHRISISGEVGDRLFVWCACTLDYIAVVTDEPVPLGTLTDLAHDHIEKAEAEGRA